MTKPLFGQCVCGATLTQAHLQEGCPARLKKEELARNPAIADGERPKTYAALIDEIVDREWAATRLWAGKPLDFMNRFYATYKMYERWGTDESGFKTALRAALVKGVLDALASVQ